MTRGIDAPSRRPRTAPRRATSRGWPNPGLLSGPALAFGIALAIFLIACSDDSSNDAPPASPELIAAGQAVYEGADGERGCAGCHGADGTGARAEGIVGASISSIRESLEIPAMSSLDLSDEQIEALAAYLQSLEQ